MWTIKYVDKRVEMTKGTVLDDQQHRAVETDVPQTAKLNCEYINSRGGVKGELMRNR